MVNSVLNWHCLGAELLFLDYYFPQYWIYNFSFFINMQYNWLYFREIFFLNALWVRWHLVSNQDSIYFREHIVQTKTSLFEKVQKLGHFDNKGNLLTYCCFKNYFAYVLPPLFLFFFSIYTNFSGIFIFCDGFLLDFLQNHLVHLLFP